MGRYLRTPDSIEHSVAAAGDAIDRGEAVRIGELITVALQDIPAGGKGNCAIKGEFAELPKDGNAMSKGAFVQWDDSADRFAAGAHAAANDIQDAVVVVEAAAAAAGTFTGILRNGV